MCFLEKIIRCRLFWNGKICILIKKFGPVLWFELFWIFWYTYRKNDFIFKVLKKRGLPYGRAGDGGLERYGPVLLRLPLHTYVSCMYIYLLYRYLNKLGISNSVWHEQVRIIFFVYLIAICIFQQLKMHRTNLVFIRYYSIKWALYFLMDNIPYIFFLYQIKQADWINLLYWNDFTEKLYNMISAHIGNI